jgi:hypothetical protein
MIGYVASLVALVLLGAPIAISRRFRELGVPARIAIAFASGTVALTVAAILVALVHIQWNTAVLTLATLSISIAAGVLLARSRLDLPRFADRNVPVAAAAMILATLAVLFLFAAVWSGRATSPDFVYFWGVKAARWSAAGGFEPEFLRSPHAIHSHVNYPPLFPVTLGWSALWAGGDAHWRFAPLTAVIWVLLGGLAAHALLRLVMRSSAAAVIAAFWTAALARALAESFSAGNAEAPLVFFLTLAGLALFVDSRAADVLAAIGLAGAALTKLEGSAAVALLLAGLVVREVARKEPGAVRRVLSVAAAPAACLLLWYSFMLIHHTPVTDWTRERAGAIGFEYVGVVFREMARHLNAGSLGLSWLFPALMLAARWRRISFAAAPGITLTVGLLFFYFVYYLHAAGDPTILIGWTLSRTSLPALSLWILTAGLIGASRAEQPA